MGLIMYEALRSAKKVAGSIPMESVSNAMLIDGEEIRPVVETVMDELNGGRLHIPNVAPVSSNVWVEFNTPSGEKYDRYNGKVAALLVYEERPHINEDYMLVLSSVAESVPYNYKWKITTYPYYMPKNTKNIIPLNGTWVTFLNESGGSIYSKMLADTKKSATNIKEGKIDFHNISAETIKNVVSPYDLILSTYINCVACFAVCTMHTKNVEIRERKGITSIKRKGNEKREYSEFKYHTINVETFRRKYTGENVTSEKGNREVALHFVRGHFKTYTPEKPLFGKYVGTVWVPDTMRGNKEAGIVNKDYKVMPDKKK